ncbi:Uncharacterised protein [Delftia tsuruhatensis]|uniref:hypothetical protein n=1 Tax=Delftia tsuruhatensis TaxID=180282 RepID=UPI001E7A8AC5|nr:hypothetical protein [Delftia tsuruhatensis]CAB5670327.1 Uncharacterised protein [Delftia tsuruhatensis]CAC9682990.1 Uncharacterised protein [Delftia tsuruhatensis]
MTIEEKKAFLKAHVFKNGENFISPESCDCLTYLKLMRNGVQLCQKYNNEIDFLLVDGSMRQAVAIHNPKVVVVYKGLIEHILRLASMICATLDAPTPRPANWIAPWRTLGYEDWLRSGGFDLKNKEYWWLFCAEHRLCFDYYVENLFEFVVLHEIGHIFHKHGWRRTVRKNSSLVVHDCATNVHQSNKINDDISADERIAAHAREIVADTFAFNQLAKKWRQLQEQYGEAPSQHGAMLEALINALLLGAPFFWSLGVIHRMNERTQKNPYPTHMFRLHAVESDALRLAHEWGTPHGSFILNGTMKSNTKLIADITGDDSHLLSRLEMNEEVHGSHYKLIIEEKHNWENFPEYSHR